MNLLRNGLLMRKTGDRRRTDLTEESASQCGFSAEFITSSSSPRSSFRHSSSSAVPPIRQRFSWSRLVSHTIAPHLTHMDACSRSSTGYHVPPRVWPRLPAVSSQLASALWYCSVSSPRHIFDLKISHTSRVYMVKMDYFTELPRSRLSPGPIDRGSSEAHLLCRKRKSGGTLGKT